MWSTRTATVTEGSDKSPLADASPHQPLKLGRFTVVKECRPEKPTLPVLLSRCEEHQWKTSSNSKTESLPKKMFASTPAEPVGHRDARQNSCVPLKKSSSADDIDEGAQPQKPSMLQRAKTAMLRLRRQERRYEA
mmetsp:Transcript_23042/g.41614  ORF Transcript_23042/g.41614 Transcript_23042/m.41614 type:complete len:135 (-) Transcript_23042:258-662(-)